MFLILHDLFTLVCDMHTLVAHVQLLMFLLFSLVLQQLLLGLHPLHILCIVVRIILFVLLLLVEVNFKLLQFLLELLLPLFLQFILVRLPGVYDSVQPLVQRFIIRVRDM